MTERRNRTKGGRIEANRISGSNNKIIINNEIASENNVQVMWDLIDSLESENARLTGHIQLQSDIIRELRGQLSRYEEHTNNLLNLKPK